MMHRVDRRGPDECWLWLGARDKDGYGLGKVDRRMRRIHRAVYELFVGPIPAGLTIDHLCRVRHCCNPAHLEPVTIRENTLRGTSPSALNARKTHCKRGHALSAPNGYINRKGERQCRACAQLRTREHRERANVS